ncbi:MAG: hypothetical protein C5B50_04495 [Verrucomicrobia bacterium]|nr:MAG: hypothetical protein C5B50_04495 [Verrucomicrobiota bacterium]
MQFEWDAEKNRENVRKHAIDFADVPAMFEHPMVTFLDQRKDYGEDRWIGIGLLKGIPVVVVFTERGEDTTRIISARKATKQERRIYADEIQD